MDNLTIILLFFRNSASEYIHYTVGSKDEGEIAVRVIDILGREALSKTEIRASLKTQLERHNRKRRYNKHIKHSNARQRALFIADNYQNTGENTKAVCSEVKQEFITYFNRLP